MATYITLVNLTEQGARNIKDSPARLEATKAQAEKLGLIFKSAYWTTGQYDMVLICEGSEDAAMTALLAGLSQGNVRTQTMRAYSPEEMKKFVSRIS